MNQREISKKLTDARVAVLEEHPFFGRLLLKLSFGLSQCGTAYTDMKRIVFDPEFVSRLSLKEVKYVLVHEVLHCVLKHCTRGRGKQNFIYNVACDIVVNSVILEMYNMIELSVDGESLMHLAPDGQEGRCYTADEVYDMLMKMTPKQFAGMYAAGAFGMDSDEASQGDDGKGMPCGSGAATIGQWEKADELAPTGAIDSHKEWENLEGLSLEDLWEHHIVEASANCGEGSGIPGFIARYLKEVASSPRTNWRQVLHDFIQFDRSDYNFLRPDRRYTGEIMLPSFMENMYGSKVENLWFFVDTSGSVSDNALSVAYDEIKQATQQIDNLSGMLSFFDYEVSEPEEFESFEDILSIKPIGGGGTSFRAVFAKLAQYCEENDPPNAVIILTDGYAPFPDEEAALGVPVIWMIVDSDVVPPWGVSAYISTTE